MWILVVEDETSMREALRQGLEEENHTVALASDGLEGIHAAEACDFDAILLDVMMPGMDGIDIRERAVDTVPADGLVCHHPGGDVHCRGDWRLAGDSRQYQ